MTTHLNDTFALGQQSLHMKLAAMSMPESVYTPPPAIAHAGIPKVMPRKFGENAPYCPYNPDMPTRLPRR